MNTCCLSPVLRTLIKRHNCIGIKTSFEDEGASPSDINKLRTLTSTHDAKLCIKIGGAEAKSDIRLAMDACCDSIVGPMIESQYAFEKYMKSCQGLNVTKGINIETFTATENIDLILSSQYITDVDYFVIGRVDLMGSLGKSRNMIENEDVCKLIEDTYTKIKKKNKKTYLGGSISTKSKAFIHRLYEKKLLDYIETRYVIMKLDHAFFDTFDDAVNISHQFELEWMKFLSIKYSNTLFQINDRIKMATTRVNHSFVIDTTTLNYRLQSSDEMQVCNYNVTFIRDPIHYFIKPGDFIIADARFSSMMSTYRNIEYIEARETNKTIETVMRIIKNIKPDTIRIVVLGGGLVQDVGSFVSSIYNRGIQWVYFPTTLLSMADSCIGSKTSLNTDFKNKIGTFYSPSAVYINITFLETLDVIHIKSGLGEILKLCAIGNVLHMYNTNDIPNMIKLALVIKKSVVEADLYDKNIRKGLNYGHTIGHAIEVLSEYRVPHGLAVVHGMLLMNRICGYSNATFEHHSLKLVDTILPKGVDFSNVKHIIEQDKKAIGTDVTCVVPNVHGIQFVRISSQKIQDQLVSIAHS